MLLATLSLLVVQAHKPIAEMDFELYNNLIHVPVTVNGHSAIAVLDTGAGTAVMSLELADQWKLAETGDVPIGGIGKDQVHGKILIGTTASVGGITTPIQIAIPLHSVGALSGRPLEVVLGYEFFAKHVVEVDYGKRHLRIYEEADDESGTGVSTPIHIVGNHIHLQSEAVIGGKSYSLETLVDTGAASSGGFSTRFMSANKFNVPMTPASTLGGGVGGNLIGSLFRADSLRIGGHAFQGPVLNVTSQGGGASGANTSYDFLLGGEVLKRFDLVIDYPHKRLIFKPEPGLDAPFEADKSGLKVLGEGADFGVYRISGVLEGSSGAAAGFQVGDVIDSIDGVRPVDLQSVRDHFRAPMVKGWDLVIQRNGTPLKIHLEAKSII